MKNLLVTATFFAALASPVLADKMEISPNGTRKTALGPLANFTGTVMVNSYFGANEDLPQTGALVTFLPGARSAWHTHPAGRICSVIEFPKYPRAPPLAAMKRSISYRITITLALRIDMDQATGSSLVVFYFA